MVLYFGPRLIGPEGMASLLLDWSAILSVISQLVGCRPPEKWGIHVWLFRHSLRRFRFLWVFRSHVFVPFSVPPLFHHVWCETKQNRHFLVSDHFSSYLGGVFFPFYLANFMEMLVAGFLYFICPAHAILPLPIMAVTHFYFHVYLLDFVPFMLLILHLAFSSVLSDLFLTANCHFAS